MKERYTRRDVIRGGTAVAGTAIAGCLDARGNERLLAESFEGGMTGWDTAASIGLEEPLSAFEWRIERSRDQAADGDWSVEVFTEGDHDDGTAWVTREVTPPAEVDAFEVTVQAWSESESFNTLRHLVASLGPEPPADEADFPDPGMNTSAVSGAPYGGLREPLHLADGWREYTFRWEPDAVPDRLYLAVGVSVVWETATTHYVDAIEVTVR